MTSINLKKIWLLCLTMFILTGSLFGNTVLAASQSTVQTPKVTDRWTKLEQKYLQDKKTNRLIFVKYQGGSKAILTMMRKIRRDGVYSWKRVLSCHAYVGQNGLNKKVEGDKKTPTGTYWITSAFGINRNPGTRMPYLRLKPYHYWSDEKETYNQLVDSRDYDGRKISGEHLIEYNPWYRYALAISYNPKNIYKKGSAIFLHVKGPNPFTMGCISVAESKMIKIMQNVTEKTRICIYSE